MSLTALAGVLVGAGLAGSLVLFVAAWRGWQPAPSRGSSSRVLTSGQMQRLWIAIAAGVAVAVVVRWPVAVAATVGGVLLWPKLFGGAKVSAGDLERLEALTVWTESLRDTISGAIGLEQAIPSTLAAAPDAIRGPLQRLVGQLRARTPLAEALTRFADDLNDPAADLVLAALILNARVRGPGLVAALTGLAETAREEIAMRVTVEQRRKSLRRSAKIVVGVTLGFLAVEAIFMRSYMEPFGTVQGQFVLIAVAGLFLGVFMWMRKLMIGKPPERFLVDADHVAVVGGVR